MNKLTEIERLISQDKLETLFDKLLNNSIELENKKQIILLSNRYSSIKNSSNNGTISFDDYNLEKTKITASLIQLKDLFSEVNLSQNISSFSTVFSDCTISPNIHKKKSIRFTKGIKIEGLLQFIECEIEIHKSDIILAKIASIIFTNCNIRIISTKIYSKNGTIGESLKFENCNVEIQKSDFTNINQLTVENKEKNLKTTINNCNFNKFNHWISIDTQSNETTIINKCNFNKFEKHVLYINSKNTFISNVDLNKCDNGIVLLVENYAYYTSIANSNFNEITNNAIEITIKSLKSKLYISDINCNECDTGLRVEMRNEQNRENQKGELRIEERIVVSNFNTNECPNGITINGYDE